MDAPTEIDASGPVVDLRTFGYVSDAQSEDAKKKLRAAWAASPRPVISASMELRLEANPAMERPAIAKASVDVSGRVVRAHVADQTLENAVGILTDRIRRSIKRLAEKRQTATRRSGRSSPGEWRHGDLPTDRPDYLPRRPEERELTRVKTYSVLKMTPEEAAFEMEMLGNDFHLYVDATTGSDCVIARRGDGELELVGEDAEVGRGLDGETAEFPVRSVAAMTQEGAIAMLDASGVAFVAYVDGVDGRMRVVYRRYDGHYGLVGPADN